MSDDIDVTKLKVPELRAELGKRGLNTFGTRQVLVDRLCEAMGTPVPNSPVKSSAIDADEPPVLTSSIAQKTNSEGSVEESPGKRSSFENGTHQLDTEGDSASRPDVDHKRRRSPSPNRRRSRSRSRDRDSRRSPRRRSRSPSARTKVSEEKIGWENSPSVFLDSYNSDLSLLIDSNGFTAKPQTDGGFSMMWSGVRANYGLLSGKAFFEVKSVRHLPVENLDSMSGGAAHVMRVGWSTDNTELTLGEEPYSFGYGGTAKKSTDNKFSNYGCAFGEGDVIGAFLEWTSNEAVMRFSVNGVDQGECFRARKDSLGERYALFPHVYVKNVEFGVNFGQDDQSAWFPPNIQGDDPMSWPLINNVAISTRVHGRMPPASKAECEVLMMMGLPGCGKTYYADRLRKEESAKQYNTLGTNLILDKMKVIGLARQKNYHGRWEVLIDKATKCLNVLINMASTRRRNYILDQTNVYPTAQRRKMRPFEGFKRKAIVIVPTDEEFRRRITQREKEEGKEVPESAVLEMKANFGIPSPISEDPSSVFDEVIFNELDSTEARELVQKYNQEGQANRPPPEKRQRWDGNRDREDNDSRDSRYRGGGGGGGGGYDRDRGRDYGRGRRDDFRSYDRRDDGGRRDYRGGYSAERDRSRESDRYDRSRDRDYGRPQDDRFRGPGDGGRGGRYGPPPGRGGGFPPNMGPGGGYNNGYGGGGPRGGPMMMRGGRGGGGPMMGRGYGNGGGPGYGGGPPMDFRGRPPMRGGPPPHGGYRGGPDAGGGYGGPRMDPMYGDSSTAPPPPGRFDRSSSSDPYGPPPDGISDIPPPNSAPVSGGYPGGGYSAPPGVGPDSNDSRGGRGGAPTGRGGPPFPRGRGGFPSGGRGGYPPSDRDASYGASRSQSYNSSGYPGSGPNAYGQPPPSDSASYPRGDDYSSSQDRYPSSNTAGSYSSGTEQSTKPSGGYSGAGAYQSGPPPGYPSSGSSQPPSYPSSGSGYPSSGSSYPPGGSSYPPSGPNYPPTGSSGSDYPSSGSAYPTGYAASDNKYPNSTDTRGGSRPGAHPEASRYGTGPNDRSGHPNDSQPTADATNASSLYASGAARYGESRPTAPTQQSTGPRQSRFDSKPSQPPSSNPPPPPSSYAGYSSSGGYASGYPGGGSSAVGAYGSGGSAGQSGQTTAPPQGTMGAGPRAAPTAASQPVKPTPTQQPPSVQSQPVASAFGYGYGAKPEAGPAQSANPSQPNYGSADYRGYAGYGSSYGQQPQQQVTATGQAPSLYASAVAGKPQASQPAAPAATTPASATPTNQSNAALAAYASYYGYGNPAVSSNPTSASQPPAPPSGTAAQQFNAWPAAAPTGTAPVAGTPANTASSATNANQASSAAAAAAAYSNYYSGYQQQMYSAAGYGAPGSTASATGATPAAAAPPPPPAAPSSGQAMPPYGYAGYR